MWRKYVCMQLLASCVTTTAIFTYICFSSWYYINITTILNFPGPIKPWKKIYNNALQLLMWRNMFMDHAAGFQIVCQYNKKTTCVFLFVLAMNFWYIYLTLPRCTKASMEHWITNIHNYIIESYMVHLYTLGERSIFAPCIMHEIQTIQRSAIC